MAIKLTDKPNTIAAGGDYPYGDIRDRDGLTPGTPVSREVYSDFHQFFERLMERAGVTHNGLPDNNANGFQLFEALINLQRLVFESFDFTTFDSFFSASTNITGFKYKYNVTTQGMTEIDGSNDNSTFDLSSLGKLVPVGYAHRIKIKSNLNGAFNFRILLNATGLGAEPMIIQKGVSTSNTEYVYTEGEIITFVRTFDGWQLIEE